MGRNIVTYALLTAVCTLPNLLQAELKAGYERVEDSKNSLTILSPALKERKTAKIRLSNGLEAYLISDPSCDQSAAALSVEAGSWQEPQEYLGLAHFCEHMVFHGSEKYPTENSFFQYVFDNDGTLNAHTMPDRTTYMFAISHAAFSRALDEFAHFFIDPLFLEHGMRREMLAVHQEYSRNCDIDPWREQAIIQENSNPEHPHSLFSIGTKETLQHVPRERLVQWYKTHYSAHKMHLIIYSNQSIEALTDLTMAQFSAIPVTHITKATHPHILSNNLLGHMTYIEPLQDRRKLSIMWEIPRALVLDLEAQTPTLIGYALSDKGQQSLFDNLRESGLAEELVAYSDSQDKYSALFKIDIYLTKAGVQQVDQVIESTFQMLNLYKKQGLPAYVFTDYRKMKEISYQWQSRSSPFHYVMHYADSMVDEPLSTFPLSTTTLTVFKPKQVREYLASLTPTRAAFVLLAPSDLTGQPATQKEKWLGGCYSIQPIDERKLQNWDRVEPASNLKIAAQNSFIPNNLKLISTNKSQELTEPLLLIEDNGGQCFFLQDNYYLTPTVLVKLGIKSPLITGSARQTALVDLYTVQIDQKLSSLLSTAKRAGIHCTLTQKDLKLNLSISGYYDKAPLFITSFVSQLKTVKATKEEFELYRETLLSDYENQQKSAAFNQAYQISSNILYNNAPTGSELYEALSQISYAEFSTFTEELFQKNYVECLITGNISAAESGHLFEQMKQMVVSLPYPTSEQQQKETLLFPKNRGPSIVRAESLLSSNATILMLQIPKTSWEERAAQELLNKALSEAFFTTLRTKQQTAYLAKSWAVEEDNSLLLFFGVQSTTHTPDELLARFELFLEDFQRSLKTDIPEERFANLKSSLITTLLTPPNNLSARSAELYNQAFIHHGDFKRTEKLVAALNSLTYDAFCDQVSLFLSRQNNRRLAITVTSPTATFTYTPTTLSSLKN